MAIGIDSHISETTRHALSVRLLKQYLDEARRHYDSIMLHHYLEHMADPEDAMKHVRRLLKPNDKVLIRIPVTGIHALRT